MWWVTSGRVGEVDRRPLHGEHTGDESPFVAQRESDLKPLQQLKILREILAWESAAVVENERYVGLLQDAVVDKVVSLRNSDDLGQQVSQPDWVNKVEIIETT